jgi:phosphinothricin acetyltransferase
MIIRDALESDLPAIIDIYNATVPTRMVTAELEPTTVEARLPWFREHSPDQHPVWVAESDGRVIGWLDFKKFLPRCAYRGTAEISVYVDEKFRRRGVARRLLEEAISRVSSLGITALVGLIFGHNEPSLKLFERLGFQRWGLLPAIARLGSVERDLIVMGRHCPARHDATAESPAQASGVGNQLNDSLSLMRTLMQYRQEPIHSALLKVRDKHSMLHLDVLILIYHFAKICSGQILEIGAFVGGATIAAAFGVRDSDRQKKLIAIEPWRKRQTQTTRHAQYLARFGTKPRPATVSELVTLIKSHSFEPKTISTVHHLLGRDEIGLLILDADAAKRRDIESYRDKFADGCWMVIDDYYGADSNAKTAPSRADVDALMAAGCLEPWASTAGAHGWAGGDAAHPKLLAKKVTT